VTAAKTCSVLLFKSNQIRTNRARYLFRYRFNPSGAAIFAVTPYWIEASRRSKLALYVYVRSIDPIDVKWKGSRDKGTDHLLYIRTLYDNRFAKCEINLVSFFNSFFLVKIRIKVFSKLKIKFTKLANENMARYLVRNCIILFKLKQ